MTSITGMYNEPSEPQINEIIARINDKKFHEASLSIDDLIEVFADSSILYSLRGTIELSKGDFDKAVNCFRCKRK